MAILPIYVIQSDSHIDRAHSVGVAGLVGRFTKCERVRYEQTPGPRRRYTGASKPLASSQTPLLHVTDRTGGGGRVRERAATAAQGEPEFRAH